MEGVMYAIVVASLLMAAGAIVIALVVLRRSGAGQPEAHEAALHSLESALERLDRTLREEVARNRGELAESLNRSSAALLSGVGELSNLQKAQLDSFAKGLAEQAAANERRMEALRATVDDRLRLLAEENSRKLDQMRQTVDEKLQGTLEQRLGESFKLVSERLEMVHRGLGEMQTLAVGVGDLKKVLTNVKTRGTLAEVQLGSLLEQMLSPEQYDSNVETRKNSNQRVEYAIKLPGRDGQENGVWLPVDAKFPLEDYRRLLEAQERSDLEQTELAGRRLEESIKASARKICESYIDPPDTTDFAIMFLGTEGLYAEALRRPGLFEHVQRQYRVTLAGPTTLCALLNSFQMGFRTLAIQKRAGEVWLVLGAVKNEFGKFGDILEAVQKKLQEAQNKIEDASRKSRTIERKLQGVEQLSQDAPPLRLSETPGPSEC